MSLSSFQRRRRELSAQVKQVKKEEPKVSGSSDNNRKRKSDSTNKNK